jgi:hypothetical protein
VTRPRADDAEVDAARSVEERVRAICTEFPGVEERRSHGAPGFFVGKQFLMLWPEGHHDYPFAHLWCAAPPGAQDELVTSEPRRFFRPPYVGGRGWVGVRLDQDLDWGEIRAICIEAYRTVAPRRLLAQLEDTDNQ